MANLINRAECKRFALKRANEMRRGWLPTRVGGQFLDDLECKVMRIIQESVKRHRTVGKTILDLH
jgi:hypothetical protein